MLLSGKCSSKELVCKVKEAIFQMEFQFAFLIWITKFTLVGCPRQSSNLKFRKLWRRLYQSWCGSSPWKVFWDILWSIIIKLVVKLWREPPHAISLRRAPRFLPSFLCTFKLYSNISENGRTFSSPTYWMVIGKVLTVVSKKYNDSKIEKIIIFPYFIFKIYLRDMPSPTHYHFETARSYICWGYCAIMIYLMSSLIKLFIFLSLHW